LVAPVRPAGKETVDREQEKEYILFIRNQDKKTSYYKSKIQINTGFPMGLGNDPTFLMYN